MTEANVNDIPEINPFEPIVESVDEKEEMVIPEELFKQHGYQDVKEETPEVVNEKEEEKPFRLDQLSYENLNVTIKEPISSELPEDNKLKPIPYTPVDEKGAKAIIESDFIQNAPNGEPSQFIQDMVMGFDLLHTKDYMLNGLTAEGSDWRQFVENGDIQIRPFRPKWKVGTGTELSGVKAIDRIRTALKQGSTLTIPCWASGIWLTIKAPTVLDLADNYDLIHNEIIELGKQTAGGIFENSQVYLNKNLVELVKKLFYSWSLNEAPSESRNLEDVLLVEDLETIAWALGVCMYPNGYPFREVCVEDLEMGEHVNEQLINLSKIHIVNQSKLTQFQKDFMSNPTLKRSFNDIEKYRSESSWYQSNEIKLKDYPFKIYLKTPTVREYINSGYRWINHLKDSVRDIVYNADDRKLNRLVFERAGLTIIRQYGHFVKSIVFEDGTRISKDIDVEEALNEICKVPEAVTEFVEKVTKHIGDNAVTMVALPRHKCPGCGKDPKPFEQTHPYLIPISALKLFFNLRDQQLALE